MYTYIIINFIPKMGSIYVCLFTCAILNHNNSLHQYLFVYIKTN